MQKGFTLIELMVSVTIFIVVMVISLGSLLSISAAERKAESLKTVMNNLNFALESMARSIRTGVDYHCINSGTITEPQNCQGGDTFFAFKSSDLTQGTIRYCLGNGSSCSSSGTAILRSVNGSASSPITASEVVISNLTFYVVGATPQFQAPADNTQPKVVITINGSITLGNTPASQFKLQTTVTQRLYDQ